MTSSRIMLAWLPFVMAAPAAAQGTAEQRAACGPEAVRLCASSIPNVAKVTECLKEKRDSLNAACQTAMDSAGAEQQPKTAEAPAPSQPEPERSAPTPGVAARADQAAPKATTPPAPPQQTATAPSKPHFDARKDIASGRNSATRRQVANRQLRQRPRSDTDEAVYWMRRVTGYSGPINVSAFDRRSYSGFTTLFR